MLGKRYSIILLISHALWLPVSSVFASDVTLQKNEKPLNPWLLRIMLLEIAPINIRSDIPTIGGKVETPRQQTVGMDISYFVTQHLSLEIQGGQLKRNYRIKGSKLGSFDVGTVSNSALSLTLQYHLNPLAQFSPYFGLGINHSWTRDVQPAAGIPVFKVNGVTSGIFSTGIDYRLSAQWSFSTSLRYIISPEYRFQGANLNSTVSMNTLIAGIGLSYRL